MRELINALRDQQLKLLASFVDNPATDMSDYRQRVGEHIGLQFALDTIIRIDRENDRDPDERE